MTAVVLDASVGAKWFRDEAGTEEARQLLQEHGRGEISIVVPSLFVYELMSVATRSLSPEETEEFWDRFISWRVNVREVGDSIMRDALALRRERGISLYDAVAPALAAQLRATLYTADRRAHEGLPGVVFVG